MITTVSITAIHSETNAVIVMQNVTSISESSGVWTVTIADQTLTFDRTAWAMITNSIAAPTTSENP